MVIVYDTAVRADRHINAGFLEILVTGSSYIDQGSGLSAADTLGLTGDADRAAADTNFHKVSAGLGKEHKAVTVNYVACADLYAVAIVITYPLDGVCLPAGVALGGVDTQHVSAGSQQCGNTLSIVPGVDTCAYQVPLFVVQQFLGIGLVGGIVLAEYEVHQPVFIVHDGKAVELMLPNDIVGSLQCGVSGGNHHFFSGSHKGGNLLRAVHTAYAVVTAGDDTQQLAGGSAIFGDCHGGEAVAFLQCQHIVKGSIGSQVGGGNHKACLVALDLGNHCCLRFDGLRAVDKAQAALLCQGNCQRVVGNGLHNGRGHRNVQ